MRTHGRPATYSWGCRCQACRLNWREYQRAMHKRRRSGEHGEPPHGTVSGYVNWGCRCDPCRHARTDYMRWRRP